MEILKFKTNINCGGCVAKVTPTLNSLLGINNWEVDTTSADKMLTIENKGGITVEKITTTLLESGFRTEKVK